MADEIIPTAPIVDAPVAPVVVEPVVVAEPVTPAVVAEPIADKPAEPEKLAEPVTLLAEKAPEKPVEKIAAEGEKPADSKAEGSQSDEPAPLPAYEPFTFPEGVTFDEARLGDFTKTLGEFEIASKADHAEMQKFGQQLLERHTAELQNAVTRVTEAYQNIWEKQRNDWKESFIKANPNNYQTIVDSAKEFIGTHGGSEAEQNEFKALMESTGLGNHPAMIRLMANAMKANAEGKPLPALKPATQKKGILQTFYGKN